MCKKGTSLLGVGAFTTLFICLASGQTQTQEKLRGLVQFVGTNGSDAVSDLIQLPNGNFLGVTLAPSFEPKAPSTIYELKPGGVIQNLYRLAADGSQGLLLANAFPNHGVVQASDGNIYGIMYQGGTSLAYGLIYRLTLPSKFEVLHNFSAIDGGGPVGKMVQALDGNLYGVTQLGGTAGGGSIFRIGLDGSFAVVYSFIGGELGSQPASGLALHPNGLLYGAAGSGAIYQLDPVSGKVQLISPGPVSSSPPVVGNDGGLYFRGGPPPTCPDCSGSLVRYGTDGSGPKVEFAFPASASNALGSLIQASDGTFVGGGATAALLVDPVAQSLAVLPFPIGTGYAMVGSFVEGANGGLIGAIPVVSKTPRLGALMALTPPFPKPQPTILGFYPASASVGATVTVLGGYFVGATGVAVNGTTASFTVQASGAIQFLVPAGASSGPITIFNQGGSAVSAATLTVQ